MKTTSERTILLVDDQAALRQAVARSLARDGYRVLEADSGEEALRQAEDRPVDLLITDLRMKGMSGLDLLRAMKQHHPDAKSVVITAYGSMETAVQALRLGVVDYLSKPFRLADLRAVVERVVFEDAAPSQTGLAATPADLGPARSAHVAMNAEGPAPSQTRMATGISWRLPSHEGAVPQTPRPRTGPAFSLPLWEENLPGGAVWERTDSAAGPGDAFTDAFCIDEERTGLLLAEVRGREIPAPLADILRSVVRSAASVEAVAAVVASAANDFLWRELQWDGPIHLFFGILAQSILDPAPVLRYATLGRPDVFLLSPRSVAAGTGWRAAAVGSTAAAQFPGTLPTEGEWPLEAGDVVGLLTHELRSAISIQPPPPDDPEPFLQSLESRVRDCRSSAGTLMTLRCPSQQERSTAERTVTLFSSVRDLSELSRCSDEMSRAAGLDGEAGQDVAAAVNEAVLNAIFHAYPKEGEGTITVHYLARAGGPRAELIVRVQDEGRGFTPPESTPPSLPEVAEARARRLKVRAVGAFRPGSGDGLALITALMSRVAVRSRPGAGTTVHLSRVTRDSERTST